MTQRGILVCISLLVCLTVAGATVHRSAGAQENGAQDGDLAFAVERAEQRETIEIESFPDPFVPANGAYLIVWLTVANNGTEVVEYDVCPPDAGCFDQTWFEVITERGGEFPVDEVTRSAFESSAEEVLLFGGELQPGTSGRIVLVFDVPPGVDPRSLRITGGAATQITLPILLSDRVEATEEAPLQVGMNETVAVGEIELVATRAEVRATIDLPSFPEPFTPEGEYVVVFLTLTNAGIDTAEYDICPPDGPVCVSQLWFELADADGRAYPVETIAWSAFSLKPEFLPFGSELAPNLPAPIALVFDVPAGVEEWSLNSTPEATRPFSIRLELDSAPGSIQVVRSGDDSETGSAGAAVELILDTSGSMLEALEGRRRIDVATEVLGELVAETIPAGTPLALRVFGDTADSCETNLAMPLQPLDPGAMAEVIADLEAIDGVKTPIGASLDQVAADLDDATGTKIVVLVTDGEETCDGDPAAALRALADQGLDVRVNIVGFAVADDALKTQFREWAHLGHGQYFDAAGADDLGAAIAAAVQPPFRVLDDDGDEVTTGLVGGDPVEVPAGTYEVEVLAAEPITIEAIAVEPGARVEVSWDDR